MKTHPLCSETAIAPYGYFDDQTNEFVITTPQTPRAWENRLWNDVCNIQISNHGTGIAYTRNNKDKFVIFNYHNPNRFVYILDRTTGALWCPCWYPVGATLDAYEVRHGLKYTTFKAEKDGVECTWRVTVHHRDPAELWRIDIRNTGGTPKDLLVVPFYQVDLRLNDPYFGPVDLFKSGVSEKANCLYIKNHAYVRKGEDDALALHADRAIRKYEMNLSYFLKQFSTLTAPATVLRDEWKQSWIDDDKSPCFAVGFDLRIAPGRRARTNIEIFSADNLRQAGQRSARYTREKAFDTSMAHHKTYAQNLLTRNTIHTADPVFDRYVNVWIKHQCAYNAHWNRGWGQGFRDAMSDCDAFRMFDPAHVRKRILQASAHIYADGLTVRSFFPPVEKPYFDGGVWFQNAVTQYIRETGDLSLLDEVTPYFKSDESGTILDHLKRTVAFLNRQKGPDGICRMGFGDWNDAVGGIDREGKGQSIWITMAYIFGLRNSAALLDRLGDKDAAVYTRRADRLTRILNDRFFEGDRYVRAVTDAGRRIGSADNDEGRLWIEPQGWSFFAGVADKAKAARIIAAMRRELYVPYGVMLLALPYTRYHADIGRITNDPPGIVENGSNYVQGMLFYTYGLTQVDEPDEAQELLYRVLPSNPDNPPERAQIEPFQITNSFQGPASRHPGRAMFSWRTGSAGWFLKTVWDGLLGIVPGFDGVQVRARLPKAWGPVVRASRWIRGHHIAFTFAAKEASCDEAGYTYRTANNHVVPYRYIRKGARIRIDCD